MPLTREIKIAPVGLPSYIWGAANHKEGPGASRSIQKKAEKPLTSKNVAQTIKPSRSCDRRPRDGSFKRNDLFERKASGRLGKPGSRLNVPCKKNSGSDRTTNSQAGGGNETVKNRTSKRTRFSGR